MSVKSPSPDSPFVDLTAMIRQRAAEHGARAAIVCDDETLTFAALQAMIDRCAAALQRDGLSPEDVVAICASSSIQYASVFFGALRAGLAVAPLSPSTHPDSLVAMLENSRAQILFADDAVCQLLSSVTLPPALRIVNIGAAAQYDAWLAPVGAAPAQVEIQPEWAFNIIYSSGTTGTPKGIVQSHAMRYAYTLRSVERGYGPDAVTLIATPLYSNTTLVSFFPTLALGGTVVLMPKFDARQYLELAQREHVTHTMLVPVQYQRILGHPDFDRYDLSSFRAKFCTSAPFPAGLKADALRRWPGKLTEFYGMTEGGASCELCADEYPNKLHTVGRPLNGHEMRLIDADGREVAAGEAGEIIGRSPAMMTGYYRQPEKTAQAEWHDSDGRRFIRTGDVGRFDEDGFLVLMDRKKDMIISGGFNIYPSDLEQVIARHPEVVESAVVGVPSQRWGETPVAFVTLQPDSALNADELTAWANGQLGKMQRLADVVIVDALPRSPIGKVLKRELRERFSGAVA
ncbi:Long-chain-fatty-acid--CoA ligase [Paraburkholderia hiiakae]|uniref:Long-chain-fatty-acid--CoA ligase n=1 Tax=Paraburkholderia hiiakae TaxID=1081782 RepID=A0ABN7HSP6_9BURK|nr:class I adenylate-forming enzyme family protein [Paraburkholderia hiiakae]CAD6535264.1 Long-chain-fatty-acid--CoA ligase [Paraburkholderia hiiakae]